MYHLSELPDELTTDWILSRLRQEDIYSRYLGIVPDVAYKFTNPLRKDTEPGCSFFWYNGILFFRDFAWNKTYTCFTVVRDKFEISFPQALQKIAREMILNEASSSFKVINNYHWSDGFCVTKEPKKISVQIQAWSETDKSFWKSYYLTSQILNKFGAYSIKYAWIDNKLIYSYSNSDPCTGYYFGENTWKLYFYKRNKYRFISNTNSDIIQGLSQLEPSEQIVITKSMKDVMCYDRLGISAISPQSECTISDTLIESLRDCGTIYVNYDNDTHGQREMNKILSLYPDLIKLEMPIESGHKDLSDYLQSEGINNTLNLLNSYGLRSKSNKSFSTRSDYRVG